jgi:hypothetical protein
MCADIAEHRCWGTVSSETYFDHEDDILISTVIGTVQSLAKSVSSYLAQKISEHRPHQLFLVPTPFSSCTVGKGPVCDLQNVAAAEPGCDY